MPVIFGKKCPRCKTSDCRPQHSRTWPNQVPGVQTFTCSKCKQDFFYIPPCSILIDKRISERVAPPNTLLVRIKGERQQFAKIEDISMEGIGFSYDLDLQKFAQENFTIDLYNCKQGTFLKNLPVEVVSSRVSVQEIAGQQVTILRNGARFGRLNRIQEKILKDFVEGFNGRGRRSNNR
ncbi:MAG TPA: hypothetical protein ENI88_13405 [Desulfobulbus sp.]|nr:hypothetical protein [Desulfobulbus sp.]